jgi:hypothetical protein
VRNSCACFTAPALNFPKPSEWPSKQAKTFPSGRASSVMRGLSRAEMMGGAIRRLVFFPGVRKPA